MGELQTTVPGRKLPRVLNKEVKGNTKGKTQICITPDKTNWTGNVAFGRITQFVSLDSFTLTPQSLTEALTLKIILVPPFEGNLSFKIVFGHEGSPTRKIVKTVGKDAIQPAYERFLISS